MNNLNRSRRTPSAPVVDGLHGDAAIADHFSDRLSALLSADNDVNRNQLLDQICKDLSTDDLASVSISVECVQSAFQLLKPHKLDGSGLVSDHLILALPATAEFIAPLFTSILRHGHMPAVCATVP